MLDGRTGYVGVDAYAIRHASASKFLSLCLLNNSVVRILALDAHLSDLNRLGLIEARVISGGNSFVNRWSETLSDIEVH